MSDTLIATPDPDDHFQSWLDSGGSELLSRYLRKLWTRSLSNHDVEDIVQATLVHICERLKSAPKGQEFESWILQLARGFGYDVLRRRSRHDQSRLDESESPPVHVPAASWCVAGPGATEQSVGGDSTLSPQGQLLRKA